MATNDELDGKIALIEVREWRRNHRMVIATLKREGDGVYAVFRERHKRGDSDSTSIRIPDNHLALFEPVTHKEYSLKFGSVLNRNDDQSADSRSWERPPIIVTQADIDASKNERA